MINEILQGDSLEVLRSLPDGVFNTCVTSPPYWGLRDYGVDGQLGMEETPEQFVENMVKLFREVKRVLRDDGTLWLNLGDSYWNTNGFSRATNGYFREGRQGAKANDRRLPQHDFLKVKDLVGIPWKVAFALQQDGWYLRSDIIWHKPNPMPESVRDRPTKAHEYIFLLSKSEKYYYDYEAIKEDAKYKPGGSHADVKQGGFNDKGEIPGSGQRSFRAIRSTKNKRTVWTVSTKSFKGAHFATFPPDLIRPCVLAGAPEGGLVLDPFFGAGTTGLVAMENNRNFTGIELNPEYIEIAKNRLQSVQTQLNVR